MATSVTLEDGSIVASASVAAIEVDDNVIAVKIGNGWRTYGTYADNAAAEAALGSVSDIVFGADPKTLAYGAFTAVDQVHLATLFPPPEGTGCVYIQIKANGHLWYTTDGVTIPSYDLKVGFETKHLIEITGVDNINDLRLDANGDDIRVVYCSAPSIKVIPSRF